MSKSLQGQCVLSLTDTESARLWDVSARLGGDLQDQPVGFSGAVLDLPGRLTASILEFARGAGTAGFLIVQGVEIGQLPPTPSSRDDGVLAGHPTGGTLALIADVLGSLVGYQDEKAGALIHEVHPVRGEERRIENSGSVRFDFHTENVHHPLRPDFLGLLCLRQDHDAVAASRISSIRDAIHLLTDEQVETLREPRFSSRYPTSFTRGSRDDTPWSGPHRVIFGPQGEPFMRFNSHNTVAQDERGSSALSALSRALEQVSRDLVLAPGDLVILDNHVVAHGRSAFSPRYDGRDRWLRRFYSLRSIPGWTQRMMSTPRRLPPMRELHGVL